MKNNELFVWGMDDTNARAKGAHSSTKILRSVDPRKLHDNLGGVIAEIKNVLSDLDTELQDFALDEIEVSIEISATGRIALIGSVEAGSTGGMKLKFRRHQNEEDE